MTGLECIREKLKKMGFNQQQRESKIVAAVISIIAEDKTCIKEVEGELRLKKLDNEIQERERNMDKINKRFAKETASMEQKQFELAQNIKALESKKERLEKGITEAAISGRRLLDFLSFAEAFKNMKLTEQQMKTLGFIGNSYLTDYKELADLLQREKDLRLGGTNGK